ncbi:hypothetical protein PISMIDRAFT_570941 [Pisolithus microcarpus 441]|uniref:Uncharacterized protein n=1 Tax=Pisolithus microcarpus 441 TaxID=765257 RepID=A0A0C9ZEJ9_9AGAM|nr:hypothetical protein BKA83DRAFT_570941 [Pisolithus microcarpus]KIK20882.1 hypothetical protein PISMIDRAFT_570941 [Pisolithus microcarpus 441]
MGGNSPSYFVDHSNLRSHSPTNIHQLLGYCLTFFRLSNQLALFGSIVLFALSLYCNARLPALYMNVALPVCSFTPLIWPRQPG